MSVLAANGAEIDYRDAGHGDAILLTHGYSATGDMWAPQRPALEDRYRVVTHDLRGHGRTTLGGDGSADGAGDPSAYTHAACVADMCSLLDALAIEQAVIGGLSLGGFLSLDFYRTHPQRTRALVLCATGPGYRNADARARWNATAERRARDFEERGLAALAGASREMREAMSSHRSARGLALAARGLLAQFDDAVITSLPAVAVPTLIIAGADDQPFRAPCEYMAAKIPGARLEVIENAGHAVNLDQPQRFNRILREFLDRL